MTNNNQLSLYEQSRERSIKSIFGENIEQWHRDAYTAGINTADSYEEFTKWFGGKNGILSEDEFRTGLEKIDLNGDNIISWYELRIIRQYVLNDEKEALSKIEAEQAKSYYDKNKVSIEGAEQRRKDSPYRTIFGENIEQWHRDAYKAGLATYSTRDQFTTLFGGDDGELSEDEFYDGLEKIDVDNSGYIGIDEFIFAPLFADDDGDTALSDTEAQEFQAFYDANKAEFDALKSIDTGFYDGSDHQALINKIPL